jgi:WD40 repeat protein/tRNA A-37 threonylcarbamoyl transferase component Bud32
MSDESIFAAALGKAPGAERRAFLDGACGSDDALRRRIERLLKADRQAGGILECGADAGPTDAPGPDEPPLLPDRVFAGRFKLRQTLGEGGMGEVWVADQAEPVQRRVAIKVVRPGLDSERMLARFEQERQALALMDHPNIAKVLDAGEAEGRPYFVMELIKGVPITEYCDRARLSPRERLALFVPVCEAVQHAHQKGMVHRDLKPSNILVALYDGRPVPKVIDFGIAKATGPRLTDRSIYTEVGALVGTLEYMAPEQAELNNLDIDTRADVYALGAVLYELLTGSVPFSRQELQAAGFLEMLRVIREVEPLRPSTKLSKSGTLPSVADVRRTDPQKLVSLMRGELDWIILKCLEKDRGRRYQAASGLARDLEHYLADETVEACPPTAGYRLRKFARRYRTPMLVAGAFVLLLALGAIVAAWQAVRATAAERSASASAAVAHSREHEAELARGQAEERRDDLARLNEDLRRTHYIEEMNLARVAWDENNVGRTRELLEKHRPRPGEPDLRSFEWYYLDRLVRGGQLRIEAHAGGVNSVAFMPDGRRLISAGITEPLRRMTSTKGDLGAVRLWEAATGRPIPLLLDGPSDKVDAAALSQDGTRLAASRRDQTILLWDLATGGLVTLEGPADHVAYGVRFSPDGKRLVSLHRAVGSHTHAPVEMRVWDAFSRKPINTVNVGPHSVASFSPDGRRLVVSPTALGGAAVYDSETGKEAFSIEHREGGVSSPVLSPDGTRLAACVDKGIRVWDVTTREPVAFWPSEPMLGGRLAFSRDGKHLARAGYGGNVEVWDTATGRKVQTFKGHSGVIQALAFSPDGTRLGTGGADGTVRLWDIAQSGDGAAISLPDSETRWGISDLSPDGRSLLVFTPGHVELWDTATCRVRGSPIERDDLFISRPNWSADGERMYFGDRENDGRMRVRVIETASGQVVRGFSVSADGADYYFALSPDDKWFVHAGTGHTIRVRDVRAGVETRTIQGLSDDVQALTFNPDGTRLLSVDVSGNLTLWDFATGREVAATKLTGGLYVRKVRFSRDGKRVAVTGTIRPLQTGDLRILDAETAREVWSLKGHSLRVEDADFTPDGLRLATASFDQTVRLWDLSTGQEILKWNEAGHCLSIGFVSGGRRLIGAMSNGRIRVWDATPLPE